MYNLILIVRNLMVILIFFTIYSSTEVFAQKFRITGTLRNGATEELISGAEITLKDTPFYAISNDSGKFAIDSVYEQNYVMNIKINGFQSYQAQIKVTEDLNLGLITLFPYGYKDESGAALQKTIRATNITELFNNRPNFIGGNAIYGIPPEPKSLVGNFYLDPSWNKGSLLLYKNDELVEGYLIRYNINSNVFEMRSEEFDEAISLQGLRVRNVVWIDSKYNVPRYFVNGLDLRDEGVPISGIFEVLVDGNVPLVRRTIATIRQSDYNQTLMVGNPDDKVMKRFVYFFIVGRDLIEVPSKKKNFFTIFGEYEEEMEAFADQNNLNIKEPSALFNLFSHYNSKFDGFEPLLPKLIDN